MVELFELYLFEARQGIKQVDWVDLVNSFNQGRQYWYSDSASGTPDQVLESQVAQAACGKEPADPQVVEKGTILDERVDAATELEDERLSMKIVQAITDTKRTMSQTLDEFLTIHDSFKGLFDKVKSAAGRS